MAKHGNSHKLKRLNASGRMSIAKKKEVWLMKPSPGAHKTNDSIALAIVLRDMFGLAARSKEAIKLCKDGRVKVDGRVVKDPRFPIGFMPPIDA